MISGPEHSMMINRRHIFHRFKLRQNAPLSDLFIFSAVNTSKTSFQIAKEFTIKGSGFKMFLAVTKNFQNIVS